MFCQSLRQLFVRQRIIASCVTFMLALSPLSVFAVAQTQQTDAVQMMLGQFVHAVANEGDQFVYTLALEGGGNYLLFSKDDVQAAKFSFSVVGAATGEIANSEEFGDVELELEPDEYTFTFTATADAELSAVIVGDYGYLSDSRDNPGAIFNGSYIQQEKIEDTLYARLSLPETDYFQLVQILVAGGDGDSYDIQIDNETGYEFGASDDEEEQGLLFWTKGGEFDAEIAPTAGGENLTLMVLLNGPTPSIEKGKPTTVTLGGADPDYVFAVDVENAGSVVTVLLTPDSDSVNYQVSAALNPKTEIGNLYVYGSESKLVFMAPYTGQYVIQVTNNNDPIDFTITATEGDVAPELPVRGKVWGKVGIGEDAIYQLQVDSEGDFLSLIMLGNSDDLDLEARLINENGEIVHSMTSYEGDSISEMLSQSGAKPVLYEVRVTNRYGQADGKFVLSSRLETPMDFAGQWAIEATASSEYEEERYNAMQATGEPNTLTSGDFPTAWASREADAGEETLELTFDAAVVPVAINIYESNAPGAVIKVEAFYAEDESWSVIWEGSEPTDEPSRIFSPELETIDFETSQIRLTLDSASVSGWNEIDAVELVGLPQ